MGPVVGSARGRTPPADPRGWPRGIRSCSPPSRWPWLRGPQRSDVRRSCSRSTTGSATTSRWSCCTAGGGPGTRVHPAPSRPPDRLVVGTLVLDVVGEDGRYRGQDGPGGHAERRRAGGRGGHRRDRGRGLDRERRGGPPGRAVPRAAERGRHRAAGRVTGRPPLRAPPPGPRTQHDEHGRHDRRGVRRWPPRAGPGGDGQPGGGRHGPTRWVRVMADDGPAGGQPKGVDVEGRRCCCTAGRDGARVDDVCSHAAGLLSRGEVVDCVVTCPLHGSRFDVRDGQIVRGPAHHPQPALPSGCATAGSRYAGSQPGPARED